LDFIISVQPLPLQPISTLGMVNAGSVSVSLTAKPIEDEKIKDYNHFT
jgi:hypothetical protein